MKYIIPVLQKLYFLLIKILYFYFLQKSPADNFLIEKTQLNTFFIFKKIEKTVKNSYFLKSIKFHFIKDDESIKKKIYFFFD